MGVNNYMEHKNVILIGFMGTGKTTISEILSNKLHCETLDTDSSIEAKTGKSIDKIFFEDGEDVFRDLESAILEELQSVRETVISTGGGIVLRKENRRQLKHMGVVFLLGARPDVIIDRLKDDIDRPLLQGSKEEKLNRINELMRERERFYRDASDFVIDTSDRSPDNIAQEILVELKRIELLELG